MSATTKKVFKRNFTVFIVVAIVAFGVIVVYQKMHEFRNPEQINQALVDTNKKAEVAQQAIDALNYAQK